MSAGVVAGVVVETLPGAAERVAARLARRPGVEVAGWNAEGRIAAVLEAADAEALEAFAEGLLLLDGEILGVFPTFVGGEDVA